MFNIFTFLAFFAIAKVIFSVHLSCSSGMKQGPFRLNIEKETYPKISRVQRILVRTIISDDAKFVAGFRSLWKSYCYNGGPLDSNTGCFNSLLTMPPSYEDLLVWNQKRECEVCSDEKDQWGSDAGVCQDKIKSCGVWVKHKELTKYSNNNHFAHHTCNLSWRCGISTTIIPTFLKMKNLKLVPMVALPNGTLVEATGKKLLYTYGDTSVALMEIPSLVSTNLKLECIIEGFRVVCIDKEFNRMIDIEDGEAYCVDHVCYEDRKGTDYIDKRHQNKLNNWNTEKAGSLSDLKKLLIDESVQTEELRYTILKMANRIQQLEDTQLKIINSVSKIDEKLISTIFGGSFSTDFASENSFFINPCIKSPELKTNCHGNSIFSEGRWVLNSNPSNCISLNQTKNITLYGRMGIWLPEIFKENFNGIASDYQGWSFVASEKQNLIDTMEYTKNGGKGTSFEDLSNWPKGQLENMMGYALGGLSVSIIVVIVIVCVIILIFKLI